MIIADAFAFRSEQTWAKQLANLGFTTKSGSVAVTNFALGSSSTSTPTTSPTPSPAPTGTGAVTVSTSWLSSGIAQQSQQFTISADMKPLVSGMEGYFGVALNQVTSASDLAASVRFATTGVFEVRDGDVYRASSTLRYSANATYRVVMTVNVATKTYSVQITPQGGSTVTVASNFKFRTEERSISVVNQAAVMAKTGKFTITNVVSAGKAVGF